MESIKQHPWLTLLGILVLAFVIWLLVAAGVGGHDSTTTAEGAVLAPAERSFRPAGSDCSSRYTVCYATVTSGTGLVSDARARQLMRANGDGCPTWCADDGTNGFDWDKVGCRKPWRTIEYKNIFGTALLRSKLKLHFCFNGTRVFDIGPVAECGPTNVGSIGLWEKTAQTKTGWFAFFHGSNRGSWHSHLRCEYQQHLPGGYQAGFHAHNIEIAGFSNGGYTYPST